MMTMPPLGAQLVTVAEWPVAEWPVAEWLDWQLERQQTRLGRGRDAV